MIQARTQRSPRWLMPVIVALLIFGIGLRFTHLDQKVYWYDEVSTSLSVSGYSELDIVQDFAEITEPVTPKFLQTYQHFKPGSTSVDTIQRLINENPHHPPLYYLLGRQWARVFGLAPGTLRGLAAVISLVSLPCAYWLCQELFSMPPVSWMAMALIAISPLHLAYAQEARQYSLWIVLVLGSSAAFLWAMRRRTALSWGVYGVALVLGLYSQLFFGLVAIAHGFYGLTRWQGWIGAPPPPSPTPETAGARDSSGMAGYLTTSAIALLSFTPWLWVLWNEFHNADRLTTWTQEYAPTRLEMGQIWLHNLSLAFFDIGISTYSLRLMGVYLVLIGLLGYSLYYLCRWAPSSTIFLFAIMGCTALPLFLPDLLLGGRRTITPRYLLPFYLCIQLTLAYLLGSKLSGLRDRVKDRAWTLVTGLLLGAGLFSCALYSQAPTWWTKGFNADNLPISEMINRSDRPLLINNGPVPFAISQTYSLRPDISIFLEPYCTNCQIEPAQPEPAQPEPTPAEQSEREQLNIPNLSTEAQAQFDNIFLLNAYSPEPWKKALAEQSQWKVIPRYQGPVSQLVELQP